LERRVFHLTNEAIVEWNARGFMPTSSVDRTVGVLLMLVFGHSSADAIKVKDRGSPRAGLAVRYQGGCLLAVRQGIARLQLRTFITPADIWQRTADGSERPRVRTAEGPNGRGPERLNPS